MSDCASLKLRIGYLMYLKTQAQVLADENCTYFRVKLEVER